MRCWKHFPGAEDCLIPSRLKPQQKHVVSYELGRTRRNLFNVDIAVALSRPSSAAQLQAPPPSCHREAPPPLLAIKKSVAALNPASPFVSSRHRRCRTTSAARPSQAEFLHAQLSCTTSRVLPCCLPLFASFRTSVACLYRIAPSSTFNRHSSSRHFRSWQSFAKGISQPVTNGTRTHHTSRSQ